MSSVPPSPPLLPALQNTRPASSEKHPPPGGDRPSLAQKYATHRLGPFIITAVILCLLTGPAPSLINRTLNPLDKVENKHPLEIIFKNFTACTMATTPTPTPSKGAIAPDVLSAGSADANRGQGAQRPIAHEPILTGLPRHERLQDAQDGLQSNNDRANAGTEAIEGVATRSRSAKSRERENGSTGYSPPQQQQRTDEEDNQQAQQGQEEGGGQQEEQEEGGA